MQFSVRLFVENEVKQVKHRIFMLIAEVVLICGLAGLFTIAYLVSGTFSLPLVLVLVIFLLLILFGVYQYFLIISYLKKVKEFKKHIDDVYKLYEERRKE